MKNMVWGTQNKVWDGIINPNMEVELVKTNNDLMRGVRFTLDFMGELVVVEETKTDNLGTNYKNARTKILDKVFKIYNDKVKKVG